MVFCGSAQNYMKMNCLIQMWLAAEKSFRAVRRKARVLTPKKRGTPDLPEIPRLKPVKIKSQLFLNILTLKRLCLP